MNNPLKFTDPTGHMVADDDDGGVGPTPPVPPAVPPSGGDGDDDETDTDGDGVPNMPDRDYPPLEIGGRSEQADCLPGNLVECFYNHGVMPGGDYNISLEEFLQLMNAVNGDIDQQSAATNYTNRAAYDTPFYDLGGLNGNVCVSSVGCYRRQELNYIAQGAWSASVMEGNVTMHALTLGWKMDQYDGSLPSIKTLQASAVGYDYYMATHPGKGAVSLLTPFRNPLPFANTVVQYCQGSNKYC
jgi:hypothetical protein